MQEENSKLKKIKTEKIKKIKLVHKFFYEENYLQFFQSLDAKTFGTILKNSKILLKIISKLSPKNLSKTQKNTSYKFRNSQNQNPLNSNKIIFLQNLNKLKNFKNTLFVGATKKEKWILDFLKISYSEKFLEEEKENLEYQNFFISKSLILFPFKNIESIVILNYHKTEFFNLPNSQISFLELFKNLSERKKIPIFFSSATPNFSDFQNFENLKSDFFPRPCSTIISLQNEREANNFGILSEFAKKEITKRKKVLVIWNKKTDGFFECKDCGKIFTKKENVNVCDVCKNSKFSLKSKGLVDIQNLIQKEIKEISEILDFSKNKNFDFEKIKNSKTKIFLSTTAIFDLFSIKNLEFDLVIILNTQNLFFEKGENSDEKFFQKIFDIAFETSSANKNLILQTFKFNDPIVQFASFLKVKEFFEWMKKNF
ncbi:MAG: hypothetical protein Fur0024_0870 [Patescibacteria group bacterium]